MVRRSSFFALTISALTLPKEALNVLHGGKRLVVTVTCFRFDSKTESETARYVTRCHNDV